MASFAKAPRRHGGGMAVGWRWGGGGVVAGCKQRRRSRSRTWSNMVRKPESVCAPTPTGASTAVLPPASVDGWYDASLSCQWGVGANQASSAVCSRPSAAHSACVSSEDTCSICCV
jgi:hypothetical protein